MSSEQSVVPPVNLSPAALPGFVDPRGPRFGAAITSVVLAIAAVLGPVWGLPFLILQAFAFGAGSLLGLDRHPYGWVFGKFVRPRLAPPKELEDSKPPRFAQTVGLAFALAALAGVILALPVLFYLALGFALVAALLNAVFNFCLGCELYLLSRRLLAKPLGSGAGAGIR